MIYHPCDPEGESDSHEGLLFTCIDSGTDFDAWERQGATWVRAYSDVNMGGEETGMQFGSARVHTKG